MIYGFDLDGTLVEPFTATPLPGVLARLAELPPEAQPFIATNQAGPVFRAMTGEQGYPRVAQLAETIRDALNALKPRAALGFSPYALYISTYSGVADSEDAQEWREAEEWAASRLHFELMRAGVGCHLCVSGLPHWRKPAPGMLKRARRDLSGGAMTYIGDMPSDRAAADAADALFLNAAQWRERGV